MPDVIIKKLRKIKDGIAREHGYDIETLAAHLQTKERSDGQRVVDLRAMTEAADQGIPVDVDHSRP